MLIALDYDSTYTADPSLWDSFIALATGRGHEVICCTMRYPQERIDMPVTVHYTSRQAKRQFLDSIGIKPAIWIDDTPEFICFSST